MMATEQEQMEDLFIDSYAELMTIELVKLSPITLENLHYYWELAHDHVSKIHAVRKFLRRCIELDLPGEVFDLDSAVENIQDSNHDWHMILMSRVINKLE